MNAEALAEIRRALAGGEFAVARRLWESYAGELRIAIEAGTATEASMAETRELLGYARVTVRSFQAHAAARLGATHAACAYELAARKRGSFLRTL
jgi:hypothetical protein